MSLPDEKFRALHNTKLFLRSLLDPKKTPKVPKSVRHEAYWCLRHFPASYELIKVAARSKGILVVPKDCIEDT